MFVLQIILTLDYEIHGNGDGCPQDLMVEPTYKLLRLCDQYGAKLTIMADVAEILKFKEYKDINGRDDYCYDAIVAQLRHAIKTGHDVQLHIHSSYFNAKHDNGNWIQDWLEYNFADLPYERMDWMVKTCKEFLETLLKPVDPMYRCIGFRAANWSVSPSQNVVRALVNNDITIDSSVFKYGHRNGIVTFDYSRAYSQIVPWRAKEDDICIRDDTSKLWELPIYSEKRWIGAFLTINRIYRALMGRHHKIRHAKGSSKLQSDVAEVPQAKRLAWLAAIFQKHAWKADFNQCVSKQLINALNRASNKYDSQKDKLIPFILIGHSKLFTQRNERSLTPFLEYCTQHSDKFEFSTLNGINCLREQWEIQGISEDK
jgi:hypothetical protein